MYDERELLQLSGLQHLSFCPRQWGLIHLEGYWEENILTIEGRFLHERADEAYTEVRGDVRIAHGLMLRSLRLGLSGKADVVEFHLMIEADGDTVRDISVKLAGVSGRWRPFPVEYKRGRPKRDRCDEIQLCAQALCLEEMLNISIDSGALYYGKTHRRKDVMFDTSLREETDMLAHRMHTLHRAGKTPEGECGKKCERCSLKDVCIPQLPKAGVKVRDYIARVLREGGEP